MYFKYDIKIGLKMSLPWLVVIATVTLISCLSLSIFLMNDEPGLAKEYDPNFVAYFVYLFQAVLPVELQDDGQFKLPILWFLINLLICFITGKYPYSEIHNNHGISIIIKGGSRIRWFLSKWLWSISVIVICYIVIFFSIIIYCLIAGNPVEFALLTNNSGFLLSPIKNLTGFGTLQLYLLPVLTSVSLVTIQLTISLLFNPLLGFMILNVICVSSAYTMLPILVGNCSMLIRSSIFLDGGITFLQSLSYCMIETVIFLVAGILLFMHYDLLEKR